MNRDDTVQAVARLVVRLRYPILLGWLVIGVVTFPRAARIGEVLSLSGRPTVPTETGRARELIHAELGRPVAQLLVVSVSGPLPIERAPYPEVLAALAHAAARQPYVDRVASYLDEADPSFVSGDRRETFLVATVGPDHAATLAGEVPALRAVLGRAVDGVAGDSRFGVSVTGEAALEWDARVVAVEDAERLERVALAPAGLVLLLAFGALVAAVLPLVIGLYAITCALAAVHLVGAAMPMAVFVLPVVTMVGLGVGIDYSLLLVTRFREELARGDGPVDAAVRSLVTAGRAVVVSGATVMIGFAALLLTPSSETRSVGVGGLLVVAAALLLATTLLPGVLAILGGHVDRPHWLAARLAPLHGPAAWARWSAFVTRRRWGALVMGLALVALLSLPLLHLRVGIPRQGWFPAGTESARGAELLERLGMRGGLLPLRVVVRAPAGERVVGARYLPGLKRLSDSLAATPGVERVVGPVSLRAGAALVEYGMLYGDLGRARERHPDVLDAYLSPDGRTALLDVQLGDTAGVNSGMELVRRARAAAPGWTRSSDLEIVVGGFAAAQVDEEAHLRAAFPMMVLLILGATGLALLLAFRSLLVPLKAVALNLLSLGAAFGVLVLVFQDGAGVTLLGLDGPTERIFPAVLVVVFAVAFGISMDYEVFLLARIKERFDQSGDNAAATAEGLRATGRVITSAAAIMVIVFGAFAFSRLLIAQLLGFGLAVAVLVDATLIRMVIVPAFMHVAGRWNWWPGGAR